VKFLFWHHEPHGPLTLEGIWAGTHGFGGSVARLRILFWLADLGHDVELIGHVRPGTLRGVTARSGIEAIASRADAEPAILVFNNPPAAAGWQSVRAATQCVRVLWAGNNFPYEWLARLHAGAIDRIVCVSRFHRDQYRAYPAFDKIEVSYSGIDLDWFGDDQISGERHGVVFASAPRRTKGFDQLLRAWRIVRATMPSATLRVCGSARLHDPQAPLGKTGILDAELETEFSDFFSDPPRSTQAMGVTLLGTQTVREVYRELRACAFAVVNPSWTFSPETFCRSAVEAQAVGSPVIGSAAGSLPEVVAAGRTGVLVEGTDPRRLADAMTALLRDEPRRREMSRAAVAWARQFSDYQVLAHDWEGIGRRAISREPAAGVHRSWAGVLKAATFGQCELTARRMLGRGWEA
jgi:glycosyltransferase involved in cell wall biosynthesis